MADRQNTVTPKVGEVVIAASVGDYIKDELDARNTTVCEFAEAIGWKLEKAAGVVYSDHATSTEDQQALAKYFGTSVQLWEGLQAARLDYLCRRLARKNTHIPAEGGTCGT